MFYNVGWNATDKKRNATWLAKEIKSIVQSKAVHAVGISEVFSIKDDKLRERKENIMNEILAILNDGAAHPDWTGRTDAHYIFLWMASLLKLGEYELIGCGIGEHGCRKAQYLQFVTQDDGQPLHVIHNHSPCPHLTNGRRKRMVKHLFRHCLNESSAAQPAIIFGGDYNSNSTQWEDQFA